MSDSNKAIADALSSWTAADTYACSVFSEFVPSNGVVNEVYAHSDSGRLTFEIVGGPLCVKAGQQVCIDMNSWPPDVVVDGRVYETRQKLEAK